ncbi:MAG: GNAT family N-acetyltransferase [Maritimibacter sp.]
MTNFTIPTISTPRLTLRAPKFADFEHYAAFLASDRAGFMHGPLPRETAWSWFCNDTAHWTLFGYGALMIEAEGQLAGQVAVTSGIQFPEPELGWFLFDGFEGKGYAGEAALALRDWVYTHCGLTTLVSCIDPANTASIKLATSLGAINDPDAPRPAGESPDETLVYRHPAPEARA